MEIGDRVTQDHNGAGMILSETESKGTQYFLVEFDNRIDSGHSGEGIGKYGYCWWYLPEQLISKPYNSIW